MATDKSMKIPIAEVWKRRLVLISVTSVMLTLVGLVMVAVECTKLQRNILNSMTYIGFSQTVVGLVALYIIFGYTIYRYDQYPTGPVIISGHALYSLIGLALILVAYIVPADDMFHFVSFESPNDISDVESSTQVDGAVRNHFPEKFDNGTEVRNTRTVRATRWSEDMVKLIQTRLSILGGVITGIGLCGGIIPLVIIYRVYSSIQKRKKRELTRRTRMRTLQKTLRPKTHDTLKRLYKRDSVYDYAGWGNRTSDIYHGPHKDDRGSTTPSMLSAGMVSGSIVDITLDDDGENMGQWYKRVLQNADCIPKVGTEAANNDQRVQSDSSPSPDMNYRATTYYRKRIASNPSALHNSTSMEMIQIHPDRKLRVQNGPMERRHTSPVAFGHVSPSKDSEFSRKRKLASIRQESLSADEISSRSCRNVEKFYGNLRALPERSRHHHIQSTPPISRRVGTEKQETIM